MKRAALLLGILLLPLGQASAPSPDFPKDVLDLLPGWIDESAALATPKDRDSEWWPEANGYLERARDAQRQGRLRTALFHIETFEELLHTHRLLDEAATFATPAEAKSHITQGTRDWHERALRSWEEMRAQLHRYDGELRSIQAVEGALYAASLAVDGAVQAQRHVEVVHEFARGPSYQDGQVYALVTTSLVPHRQIERAKGVLDAGLRAEGVPPRVLDDVWAAITASALAERGNPQRQEEPLPILAGPVRENGEGLMAVAMVLADQRAGRAQTMHAIFGDAQSRGKEVVRDAAVGMNKQLNETTLELPRSYGLSGIFTSDAIDTALLLRQYVEQGNATLTTVVGAWSGLEHQRFAFEALARVSTVRPPPTPAETPGVGLALAIVGLVALAFATARRRD